MWCAVSPTSWRVAHSSLAVRLFVTLHSGHSAGGWELMNFRARLFGRRWLDVRGRRGHAGNMCLSADANKERWVSGQVRSLGGVVRVRVRFRLEGAVPIGGGGACEPWPPEYSWRRLGHHAPHAHTGEGAFLPHTHPGTLRPTPCPQSKVT